MKRRLLLLLLPVCFLGLALFFFQGLSLDPSQRDSALMAREFPAFEATTLRDKNTPCGSIAASGRRHPG